MIRAVQIGPAPMLTEVAWSKGRYDSYVLSPDGSMIGVVDCCCAAATGVVVVVAAAATSKLGCRGVA